MQPTDDTPQSATASEAFAEVRTRLQQIAEAVDDPQISLDDALDLYEEAVTLGLRASDLLEVGITEEETQEALAGEEPMGEDAEARNPHSAVRNASEDIAVNTPVED